MAIEGTATIEIDAPIARVYELAADIERSPDWQPEIKRAEVVKRDAEGRQVLVEMDTDAKVRTLTSELRFSYDEPRGLSWTQEEGDLKSVDGSWSFEELGPDRTRATYELRVDLGRMLGMVIRGPLVDVMRGQLVDSMPPKLKAHLEA